MTRIGTDLRLPFSKHAQIRELVMTVRDSHEMATTWQPGKADSSPCRRNSAVRDGSFTLPGDQTKPVQGMRSTWQSQGCNGDNCQGGRQTVMIKTWPEAEAIR